MEKVKAEIKQRSHKLTTPPCVWEWAVAHRGSTDLQRWISYDENTQRLIAKAEAAGRRDEPADGESMRIQTEIYRWKYDIDLKDMTQRNLQTGRVRMIRKTDRPLDGTNWDPTKNKAAVFDEGDEQQVHVIAMNGDNWSVTIKSKQSVMALKRAISKVAGTSAYEMSLYLQDCEEEDELDSEEHEKQKTEHMADEEEEQKPLSNRRRLHEFESPVVDGSVLLLVVGQRMGVGDILCDIENFQTEGKLKSAGEAEAAAAEARQQRRQIHHTAANGRVYPAIPLAAALRAEFVRRDAAAGEVGNSDSDSDSEVL